MALPEDFLRELRENSNIIDVARGYIDLKRSGGTYSCCCPFHSEKTPSCHFYPATNSFFCFGCHAGGDVITFIRLIENLDYIDAVRFLAQRANMPMPEEKADGSAQLRRRLFEMNRAAGRFWHEQLFSPEGAAGAEYLRRRGLTEHTIRHFGLGWAADDYHKLHFYMRSQGFTDLELEQGSLLARYENKIYDKFRNRVMFPIFDTRGNIIAFGGRTLSEDKRVPKYLNSGETAVFQKSDNLFALNYAKNSKADYFVLCEGYMDVITMHQAGIDSAVASLGTAVTPAHARLLSRIGKKEIILSYDADEAGQKAAARGINLFAQVGIKARVLKIEGAKDPDEFIKKFGGEAFRGLIERSGSAMDFEMDKLAAGLDLTGEDGRAAYLKKCVSFLAGITDSIDREVYITKAARLAGVPAETVRYAVNGEIKRRRKKSDRDEFRALVRAPQRDSINPDAYKTPREEKAERGIICCVFHNPEKLEYVKKRLEGGFATQFNAQVFAFLAQRIESGAAPDISDFNEGFESAQMGRITAILSDSLFAYSDSALDDYIKTLNEHNSSAAQKSPAQMTAQELMEWTQKQKEKRK